MVRIIRTCSPARARRARRPVALALAAAVAVTSGLAVMTGDAGSADAQVRQEARTAQSARGSTAAGHYLAALHAEAIRDIPVAAEEMRRALARDPENRQILARTHLLMLRDGRMDEAVPLAHRLFDGVERPNPFVNLTLVVEAVRDGDRETAALRLAQMAASGVHQFLVPLVAAWVVADDREDGGEQVEEALARLPGDGGIAAIRTLHAALIAAYQERHAEADEYFQGALAGWSPGSYRVVSAYGEFLERQGRAEDARRLYDGLLRHSPASRLIEPALTRVESGTRPEAAIGQASHGVAEAFYDMAAALYQEGIYDVALTFAHFALYLRADFPMARVLIGDILESGGRYQEANSYYRTVAPDAAENWSARLRIAANLRQMDMVDEAVALLRLMAAEAPDRPEPLMQLGDLLRINERFEEAAQAYHEAEERIGELSEQHWSLLYYRAIAYERMGEWPRAEADFLAAMEMRPEEPYLLNYLGYSWVDRGENLEQAREMIELAVELRPNDGFITDSLGWVFYRLGDVDEAVRYLEAAIELEPGDPVINDHLGDAYWFAGRKVEARYQWQRALASSPDPELEPVIREKLADARRGAALPAGLTPPGPLEAEAGAADPGEADSGDTAPEAKPEVSRSDPAGSGG